ncbi:MAG: hypothetical protein AB2L24_19275 [Mangrovibacterium sp.]
MKSLLLIQSILLIFQIQVKAGFHEKSRQPVKWTKEGICIRLNDYLNLPEMKWPADPVGIPGRFFRIAGFRK